VKESSSPITGSPDRSGLRKGGATYPDEFCLRPANSTSVKAVNLAR